ncbi:MAG: hypothetical protein QNJ65_10835 [Xenococcaceae cyanobacterium MO_234.B1]|nr:hypothetical protein [Xenococcaceae cyanobacterium MO_234.B1]
MQFTQEHNFPGAVTIALVEPKANSALVQTVRVEDLDSTLELTLKEQNAREQLEKQVEQSFYLAGKALQQLRDQRLYRSTHSRFEDYCLERFGFHRRHSYNLIGAAVVVDNLSVVECAQFVHILPTRESQCRPLTPLEPKLQRAAWQQAVAYTGGKVPATRIVKEVVRELTRPTNVNNHHYVGEVCLLLAKDEPKLRGKNKCWGIVSEVQEDSCHLQLWNGTVEFIELDYLQSLNYSPEECSQMQELATRLTRLLDCESLEKAGCVLLEHLGKIRRSYLTPLEEQLLRLLEQESGVFPKERQTELNGSGKRQGDDALINIRAG